MADNPNNADTDAAKGGEPAQHKRKPRFFVSSSNAICRGREGVELLIGYQVESVTGITKTEGGWRIVVSAVQLHRIPASTDVLADYEADIDEDGNVLNYHVVKRYYRAQVGEQE
jgi:hypothetical protein